jgi:hypothetical protein
MVDLFILRVEIVKKRAVVVLFLSVAFGFFALSETEAMPLFWGSPAGGVGSPALAAVLSLTPMPVALGQFYAGDWKAGLAFSLLEAAEGAAAAAVFTYEGGRMMYGGVPLQSWSATGQTVFITAVGAFILTKFVDAFIAASTVDAINRASADARVSLLVKDRNVVMSFALRI